MEFADRSAYDRYNEHPDHIRFVQQRWLAEVSEFLELDYAARPPGEAANQSDGTRAVSELRWLCNPVG